MISGLAKIGGYWQPGQVLFFSSAYDQRAPGEKGAKKKDTGNPVSFEVFVFNGCGAARSGFPDRHHPGRLHG